MKPNRTDPLRRKFGVFFVSSFFGAVLLTTGCLLLPSQREPSFSLTEKEARQAGALALYSKGLLLESGEGSDTNQAKEAALTAFRQAVRLDPDNRRSLTALLSNLADQGRHLEALQECELFLARRPDDSEIRLEAARAADAASRPHDAARHCAALQAAQPENRELAQALVRLLFQSGRDADALEVMRSQGERFNDKLSAALPVQWAVHFTREEMKPARALACLRVALDMRSNAVERAALLTLAGESQLMLGQTNAAVATFLHAYRENPSFNTPLLRIGTVWAEAPDATNRLARQAQQEQDPDTTLLILAATQQALDDTAAAVVTLKDVYARRMRAGFFPDEGFYLWLGSLLESRKASDDAERLFRDALAAHPSSHEMKNFLAYMWAEKGDHLEEANRLANEALLAQPNNAAYLDTKGWILFKSGRRFDALQLLLRAAELDKEEPVILEHAGDALMAIGREREAVVFWTRSHQLDPQPAVADKLSKAGAAPPKTPNPEPLSPPP